MAVVREGGVFAEVIGYDEDIREPFLATLRRWTRGRSGSNYSVDDVTADGLTHGHWLLLQDLLRGTPYAERLTSAAPLLSRLRGRKSVAEVDRIRRAVAVTEEISARLTPHRPGRASGTWPRSCIGSSPPGLTRRGRGRLSDRQLRAGVRTGHTRPSADVRVKPGHLVHIDLGVKEDGFCSGHAADVVRPTGQRSGTAGRRSPCVRDCGRRHRRQGAALKPGARPQVDAAAPARGRGCRLPGVQARARARLGRAVHDGGTLLGPRWPCYGRMTDGVVEPGNVYTLELGVTTSAGLIGLEEDVVVTAAG